MMFVHRCNIHPVPDQLGRQELWGKDSSSFLLAEQVSNLLHSILSRKSGHVGRRKGSNHSTVDPVVGGLRSGCHLLDFVDSLFGVGICSIRRMVV